MDLFPFLHFLPLSPPRPTATRKKPKNNLHTARRVARNLPPPKRNREENPPKTPNPLSARPTDLRPTPSPKIDPIDPSSASARATKSWSSETSRCAWPICRSSCSTCGRRCSRAVLVECAVGLSNPSDVSSCQEMVLKPTREEKQFPSIRDHPFLYTCQISPLPFHYPRSRRLSPDVSHCAKHMSKTPRGQNRVHPHSVFLRSSYKVFLGLGFLTSSHMATSSSSWEPSCCPNIASEGKPLAFEKHLQSERN